MRKIKRAVIWMLAAFVLGEVGQTKSCQAGFGILVLISIFLVERVAKEKKMRKIGIEIFFLVVFFCFGFFRMRSVSDKNGMEFAQNNFVTVEGTLYQIKETSYYHQYYLKDVEIITGEGECYQTKGVLVSAKTKEEIRLGNKICVYGKLEMPEKASNPGEFDWYLYYRAIGIYYQVKADTLSVSDHHINYVADMLFKGRQQLQKVFKQICTEKDYGIYCAILLGEKKELDAQIKSLYQENGISHILAISGLHISLIGMGIYRFVRKKFQFFQAQVIAGSVMAGYVMMTGAGVSSLRAYVMFLFSLTAMSIGRTYDIIVAAGWVGLFLLIQNPYLIYYTGFLLSFGAIVGIGAVGSVLCEYVGSRNSIIQSLLSSLSVMWVTLPISVYFFFTYAIYSIFLNILVVPCMTLVVVSGIVGAVLGLFHPVCGMIGIGMGHYILCFYEWLCYLAENFYSHELLLGRPNWYQIELYYGMVAFFCLMAIRKSRKNEKLKEKESKKNQIGKLFFIASATILFIIVLSYKEKGKLEVTFLDVSQGDGIVLHLPSGSYCLIDGGSTDIKKVGEYRILPFLQSKGIQELEFVFVSHADNDHISGIKELLKSKKCKIKTLCLPDIAGKDEAYLELEELAKKVGSEILYLKQGDKITEGEVSITCLHPKKQVSWTDRNAYSQVLWLNYREMDFLFTGDIAKEQEKELLKLPLGKCEVLKSAHHGSGYSNSLEFLEHLSPKYVIISCGADNSYGHPHKEALERMEFVQAEVLITKDTGAITMKSDGQKLKIETFLIE